MSSLETRRHAKVNVCTSEGPASEPKREAAVTSVLLLLLVEGSWPPMDKATMLTCVGAGNGQDSNRALDSVV